MADASSPPPTILAVDHGHRNLELVAEFLGRQGFQTVGASTLAELDQVLDQHPALALALVDVAGFDRQIWQRCDRLRSAKIPFLVISPGLITGLQQESLAHGAKGLVTKPLVVKELLGLIRTLIEA